MSTVRELRTVALEKEKGKKKGEQVSRFQEESRVLRIAVIRKLTMLVFFAMMKVTWALDGELSKYYKVRNSTR